MASAQEETLCPQCKRMIRTILSGCPNCGGPKENPVLIAYVASELGLWG